jgi:hypothetical protein
MIGRYSSALRILLVWSIFEVLRAGARYAFSENVKISGRYLFWLALADLLMVATLGFLTMQTNWKGWRLGLAVSVIPFAIDLVNFIEGTIFLGTLDFRSLYQTILVYSLMIPVVAAFFTGNDRSIEIHRLSVSRPLIGKVWRFIICDFIYVSLYLTAGLIIFPFVREFYAAHPLPSPGRIIRLQLLVRGPVFTAICLLLIRMAGSLPKAKIFVVGITFAILSGGVLLLPSSYLPDSVRWIHCAEVGSSDFIFGVLVAYIWKASYNTTKALPQAA